MDKIPATTSESAISRPKMSRFGVFGRSIKDIVMVTALSLMAVLGGCEKDKDDYTQEEKIERCYDPEHVQQYQFHQNILVALAIHIVMDGSSNSDVSIDGIKENIDDIRRVYGDIIRDFYVTRVKYAQDSTLKPGSIPGETRGQYEDRLRQYMDQNGTEGAINVMYIPGGLGVNGTYIPSEGTEFIVLYTGSDGKTVVEKTLAHELGHLLALKHPYGPEGDGIGDTINYEEECPNSQFITYMSGETCMAACDDGAYSHAASVNIMDNKECRDGLGQLIQTPEWLSNTQKKVGICVLQYAKPEYVNPDLPEVSL